MLPAAALPPQLCNLLLQSLELGQQVRRGIIGPLPDSWAGGEAFPNLLALNMYFAGLTGVWVACVGGSSVVTACRFVC